MKRKGGEEVKRFAEKKKRKIGEKDKERKTADVPQLFCRNIWGGSGVCIIEEIIFSIFSFVKMENPQP